MLRASPFSCAGSVLLAIALLAGCKNDASRASASGAPSASASRPLRPERLPPPGGPRLAILPGKGVGPIRLGATVATIERLMGEPCEEKTPTLCRYPLRALEFELGPDGTTKRIRIHRPNRAVGNGKRYGVFNGLIPPDVQFDMLIPAVQGSLGPPDRVELGNRGASPEAVSQHFYQGMVLEYDRLPNGRIVLGGVRIPD